MSEYKRHGNKWTINEILSLQREYELLEWPIQQIAYKHQRSIMAILCKLESEGFIEFWEDARGFNTNSKDICLDSFDDQYNESDDVVFDDISMLEDEEQDDVKSDVDKLTERIWNLETSVNDMSSMISKLVDHLANTSTKKTIKREPLRKY